MPTPNSDPNKRMIKVPMNPGRADMITSNQLPPDPEAERVVMEAQLRLHREAGYLPPKSP
jgi:hypothetical protein